MTSDEFQVFAKIFEGQPEVMATFLQNCRVAGIPLPFEGDESNADPDPPSTVQAPIAPPRVGTQPVKASSRYRSKQAHEVFGSGIPYAMGPAKDKDGVTRIHSCCPGEYRKHLTEKNGYRR